MPFNITIKGIDELANYTANLATTIKPNLTQAVDQIFQKGEAQMVRDCPVKTGYLRSTIQKQSGSGNLLAKIVVTADYAGIVNFGSGSRPPKPYATNGYNYILSQMKTIKISSS